MPFPYKLAVFDLDDTLAPSKESLSDEMAALLGRLLERTPVAVISGGAFERFKAQLLGDIRPSANLVLLPTNGAQRFEYDTGKKAWQLTFFRPVPPGFERDARAALEDIIVDPSYEVPRQHRGPYVEDRETELCFSALGQQAPLDLKRRWDPDRKKRQKIRAELMKRLPDANVEVAGTTSIDILPKGFNKAAGLALLLESRGWKPPEAVFVGDALFRGGNDNSVKGSGMKVLAVSGPNETARIITDWLS